MSDKSAMNPEQAIVEPHDIDDGDDDSIAGSVDNSNDSEETISEQLAKGETKVVRFLRAVVLLVLVVTATVVSFVVYRYTSDQERDEFLNSFNNHATKIVESLKINTASQMTAVDNFSTAMTNSAKETNSTWPFVTVPNFSTLARSTLSEVKALSILVNVVVRQEEREEWNKYVATHHGWKEEDIAFQASGGYNKKLNPDFYYGHRKTQEYSQPYDIVDISNGYGDDIFDWVVPEGTTDFSQIAVASPKERGVFFPLWQNAPTVVTAPTNSDMYNVPNNPGPFEEVLNNHLAVTGPSYNTEGGIGVGDSTVDLLLASWGRENEAIGSDPLGYVHYPIHEDISHKSKVVAVINMFTHWRSLFIDILPPEASVYAVFESTCNQKFTYLIKGKDVFYLDQYDLHDPTYDSFMRSIYLTDNFNENISPLYYGVPLSKNTGCQYTVRVYPTKEEEDQYVSSTPLIYTISVLCIFVFAGIVFITYDCFVEVRQRLVMRNALRSGAIVSSMFPKEIQQRLMQQEQEERKRKGKKNTEYVSTNKRIKSFLSGDDANDDGDIVDAKPLADLFPETTVMFADIENFTAWSSQRDPSQVFILLQSIYQSFDNIAHKMNVFKVETVGDSCKCAGAVAMRFEQLKPVWN